MADCAECRDPVGDLGDTCDRCGKELCSDHRLRIDHECAPVDRESEGEGGRRPLVVVSAVLAVIVIALAGAWAVTSPAVAVPGLDGVDGDDSGLDGADPGTGTTTDGSEGEPFDESAFREAVLEGMNEVRASRNRSVLARDPDRRQVADGVAADLAAYDYFQNESARGSRVFSIDRRLERANETCRRETNTTVRNAGAIYLFSGYQQPVETEDGVVRFSTPEQLAEYIVGQIRRASREGALLDEYTRSHTLGVHEADGSVYVVYLAC